MMSVLTMGSLFDGIGGFPLAAVRCGVKPLWASEIEPFPISVTRRRFPQMEHVGDITKLDGAQDYAEERLMPRVFRKSLNSKHFK